MVIKLLGVSYNFDRFKKFSFIKFINKSCLSILFEVDNNQNDLSINKKIILLIKIIKIFIKIFELNIIFSFGDKEDI